MQNEVSPRCRIFSISYYSNLRNSGIQLAHESAKNRRRFSSKSKRYKPIVKPNQPKGNHGSARQLKYILTNVITHRYTCMFVFNSIHLLLFHFPQAYCTKDRQCGPTNYCHRHYGRCHKCKNIGAKCRRDHVCCDGLECVFGRCRTIVKKGNYLSRCRKDKDCKHGLCCAKSHGEFVCKPMLRENQICSVLEGGVAYTVNHGCPCGDGLVCRTQKLRRKG